MTKEIEKKLMEGNFRFQQKIMSGLEYINIKDKVTIFPLLILTCMDPRIDVHRIFQLKVGDAFVLRNAGNIYTKDVLRSILIAIAEFDIKDIIILGHLDCGMAKINLTKLKDKLPPAFLSYIKKIDSNEYYAIKNFFKVFSNEFKNVKDQVRFLKELPDFPSGVEVAGMLYDVNTGWIFNQETIEKFAFIDAFDEHYKELLYQKQRDLKKYLEINKTEILKFKNQSIEKQEIRNELLKENAPIVYKSHSDALKEKEDLSKNQLHYEKQIEIKTQEKKEQEKVPSITFSRLEPKTFIPKVHFPKINITVPNIRRKKGGNALE